MHVTYVMFFGPLIILTSARSLGSSVCRVAHLPRIRRIIRPFARFDVKTPRRSGDAPDYAESLEGSDGFIDVDGPGMVQSDVSTVNCSACVRPQSATRVCVAVDLTNGQLTPNNNTPLLAQALSVMNNYQAAAAGFGPPASPHGGGGRAGFPSANSPGPALDVYSAAADSVGYVQAASPQPSGFPAIAVSRAPLNYTPGPLIPAAFTNGYH